VSSRWYSSDEEPQKKEPMFIKNNFVMDYDPDDKFNKI